MNRMEFLRKATAIASGFVAADQLDILERLTHRKVFASVPLLAFCALDPILSETPDDPAAAIAHIRLEPIDVRVGGE